MKYKEFITEDMKISVDDLPDRLNVNVRQGIDFGAYGMEAIAVIGQRGSTHDRYLFPPDTLDVKEFGRSLKPGYELFRISTIASKPGTGTFRPIVAIDAVKGKIAFMDEGLYADDNIKKWERPLKYNFLTIDDAKISLFGLKW